MLTQLNASNSFGASLGTAQPNLLWSFGALGESYFHPKNQRTKEMFGASRFFAFLHEIDPFMFRTIRRRT
jgi:hypothetical protein